MGIRTKFLSILLLFSLLPLLSHFFLQQRVIFSLREDIQQIARVLILQTAARDAQESAENLAANLRREFARIDGLMTALLPDVEQALAELPSESLSAGGLRAGKFWEGSVPSLRCMRTFFGEELVRLTIVPVDRTGTRDPSLSVADPSEAPLEADTGPRPVWQFPSGPNADPEKVQTFRVALPVRGPEGAKAFLLAADFDLVKLLETAQPSSRWSSAMQTMVLAVDSVRDPTVLPTVIAAYRPLSKEGNWEMKGIALPLDPSSRPGLEALLQGSIYGEEGYVSLPYESEPSLWAYAPVGKSSLGILNILPEREVLYQITRHSIRLSRWAAVDSFLAAALVVLVLGIVAFFRSRKILDPFFRMVAAFQKVSDGDFSTRLHFRAKDERRMVAEAFNRMVLLLKEGFRIRQGLAVAQEVQENFLPEAEIHLPGLEAALRIRYCDETGGDYIDLLRGDRGRLGVVVGDVTGHGVGAALLMATCRALIRALWGQRGSLADLVGTVNRHLVSDIGDTGRFVTLFLLAIDRESRRFRWVRAGHDPAWLYSSRNGTFTSLGGEGIALGIEPLRRFGENHRESLEAGDLIVIGTDGIWETAGPDGIAFGKPGVERVVSVNAGRPAAEICDRLLEAVARHRGHRRQEDDLSVVVIKATE